MTKTAATEAARRFVNAYVRTNRQWDVSSIAGCLPRGYDIPEGADYSGAVTVSGIAAFIRREAVAA